MRLVFDEVKEFERWVEEVATPERYDLYTTKGGEILLKPATSTKAWSQGYIKPNVSGETFTKIVEELAKDGEGFFFQQGSTY